MSAHEVGTGKPVFPEPAVRKPRVAGIDFNGSEWARVRTEMTSRLAELYKQCARPGIPEREADMIRGGVKELEAWLEMSLAKPLIPSDIYASH